MQAAEVFYRKNMTDECFYRVIPSTFSVEVVLAFEDSYRSIEELHCSERFIQEIILELEEVDPITYTHIRNFVLAMIGTSNRRMSDHTIQYQAHSPARA